jgi:mannosyltransferase OCH1-like enzyme
MKYYIIAIVIILVIVISAIICYHFLHKQEPAIIFEKFDFNNYTLPKIIWVYWHNEKEMPLCISNIRKNNTQVIKSWEIILLTDNTLSDYIPTKKMPSFDGLCTAQKADWIRLYLLEKYGGCWCDAGIILNDELAIDKLRDESITKQSLFTGFYYEKFIAKNNIFSYVENWFIIAPKNSSIIKTWRQEFERAMNMGFMKYKRSVLKKNKKLNLKKIFPHRRDTYLTMHGCFYYISEQFNQSIKNHILLYRAEDSMFKLQEECNWENKCMHNKLDNDKSVKTIPYIKLVGGNRNGLDLSNYHML